MDDLNKILPDLFLRMEDAEYNKRINKFDFYYYIYLTDKELDIIRTTYFLQYFGYKVQFMRGADNKVYNGMLSWF